MAVYVRLGTGHEDRYDAYNGCKHCAHPAEPSGPHGDALRVGKGSACPNCAYSEGADDDDGWGGGFVRMCKWNPEVTQGDDGSLAVKRWTTQIGFYPRGAGMSWRAGE